MAPEYHFVTNWTIPGPTFARIPSTPRRVG